MAAECGHRPRQEAPTQISKMVNAPAAKWISASDKLIAAPKELPARPFK